MRFNEEEYLKKRHGDLIPLHKLSNGLWRYRCVRIRLRGECGNLRDLNREQARLYRSCVECAQLATHSATRVTRRPVNYLRIRENFTSHQWERYHRILGKRTSVEDQKEAVELVLIEMKNRLPEGVCCRACLEGRLESAA